MAGPEANGGVVELAPDALEKAGETMAQLGTTPTHEKLMAILDQSGTGGTGITETVPSGETANITALATETVEEVIER